VPVAEAAHRTSRPGRTVALWIAFLIVIAAGIGLAWIGAGSLRPIVTESGLQFRTIKSGHGAVIGHDDAALMDYILTSDDGTVFDSSESHGGAQPFAMDGTFPGFAEAMTRMQEGGEYRFIMPQKLAWGAHGEPAPQGWPNGSALTFEVRVRKIVRGGAQMLQQMQQMQAQQQQQQQQGPQQ
jgi:hypothetical protein